MSTVSKQVTSEWRKQNRPILWLTVHLGIILARDEYLRQCRKGQFQRNLPPTVAPAAGCSHRLSELPGSLDPTWLSYLTAAAEIPGTAGVPEKHCLQRTLSVLKKKKKKNL